MEQLIGLLLFYLLYTFLNLMQRKKQKQLKPPVRPGQRKPAPTAKRPVVPEAEEDAEIPDFLRRWLEDAEIIDKKDEAPKSVPVEVEEPVYSDSALEGGYAAQSLIELEEAEAKLAHVKAKTEDLYKMLNEGLVVAKPSRKSEIRNLVSGKKNLRKAIILNEILGKPLAYRKGIVPRNRI
jgi:hypothetical protein